MCPHCEKTFNHTGHLNRHMKTHSKEKAFKCENCTKSFTREDELKRHFKIHKNEKPFTCEECGYNFSWKNDLNRHKNIHRREKEFICNTCNKIFSRKDSLRKHAQTHGKEPTHSCEDCEQRFQTKYNLMQHRRISHGSSIKNIIRKKNIVKKDRKNRQALNTFRSFYFATEEDDAAEFDKFCEKNEKEICETITAEMEEKKAVKWHGILKAEFMKAENEEIKEKSSFYFANTCQIQLSTENLSENVYSMFNTLKKNMDDFANLVSNWVLNKIENLEIKVAKYIPLRGGKYIPTPNKLKGKKL